MFFSYSIFFRYGYITSTPKPGWQDTNVVGAFKCKLRNNITLIYNMTIVLAYGLLIYFAYYCCCYTIVLIFVHPALNVPIGFQTDVNAAALGELKYGAHGSIQSCVYVTVGTGIGAGVVVNGEAVTGILHPEAGHIK